MCDCQCRCGELNQLKELARLARFHNQERNRAILALKSAGFNVRTTGNINFSMHDEMVIAGPAEAVKL